MASVADTVAGWPGSVSLVPSPDMIVVPLVGLGGLVLALWRGWGRAAGAFGLIAAHVLWSGADRPHVLVSDSGGLLGVLGEEGRALSKARGDGFAARSWLENDGDGAEQETAFARWSEPEEERLTRVSVGGVQILHATGKAASARAVHLCSSAELVVVNVDVEAGRSGTCAIYDARRLRQTGAIAIQIGPKGPVITTARDLQGARLWSQ